MTALAAALQKTSLRKKDLGLELEELEVAARMVVEDEEEQGASKSTPISSGDSSGGSSGSSSNSSDESEESSEAEGEGCTGSKDTGAGGGGGEGEMSKDNPPLHQHSSAASLIPQEPTSTQVDTLPSAPVDSRQLIQELGERLVEELQISSDKAEASCSQPNSAAAKTEVTPERSSGGTLLEPSPRKNPLLIVQTQADL